MLGGVQLQSFRDDNGRLDLAGFVEALEAQGGLSNLEAVQRGGATEHLVTCSAEHAHRCTATQPPVSGRVRRHS